MRNAENDRLLHLLKRLVAEMETSRAGDPGPMALRGEGPERSEDEDYFYFEASLAGVPMSEVDISIRGDLVFIRLGRWLLPSRHAEPVDFSSN